MQCISGGAGVGVERGSSEVNAKAVVRFRNDHRGGDTQVDGQRSAEATRRGRERLRRKGRKLRSLCGLGILEVEEVKCKEIGVDDKMCKKGSRGSTAQTI